MADTPTLFFDVGGVLLTNGWDTPARGSARPRRSAWTTPSSRPATRCSRPRSRRAGSALDAYIKQDRLPSARSSVLARRVQAVHVRLRRKLLGDTLAWVQDSLADSGKYRLFTLNNESRELHENRVNVFGLHPVFRAFFTSCYLGQVKPDEDIYVNALGMAGCSHERAIFIDDRSLNVEPALTLGFNAVQFRGLDDLRSHLKEFGVEA